MVMDSLIGLESSQGGIVIELWIQCTIVLWMENIFLQLQILGGVPVILVLVLRQQLHESLQS